MDSPFFSPIFLSTVDDSKCTGQCPAGKWQSDTSTGNIDDSKCTGTCAAGRWQEDASTGNGTYV